MSYPQIYIAAIPETIAARRLLRSRVIELRSLFHNPHDPAPQLIILNIPIGSDALDLLLLRPNGLIAAMLYDWKLPIIAQSGLPWFEKHSGLPLSHADGRTPLQRVAALRDALWLRLSQLLQADEPQLRTIERMIAAVVVMPELHANSQVQLDIDDHRQRLKLLGLNELPGLASMISSSAAIREATLQAIAAECLQARLWHNGDSFQFELAAPRFQLRLLGDDLESCAALPLLEGENIIGRRRSTQAAEYRHSIADDLVSSDHAMIYCDEGDQLRLRDMSKNGTWITIPGQGERYIHHEEQALQVGMKLRVGITRMRLERIEAGSGV